MENVTRSPQKLELKESSTAKILPSEARLRSRAIRIAFKLSALAVCLVLFAVGQHIRLGPRYKGQPLAYWFAQLPNDVPGPGIWWNPRSRNQSAEAAIRYYGTNALPFVFAKLTQPDNPTRERIWSFAFRFHIERALPWGTVLTERGQAVHALELLCPLPQWVVEKLLVLTFDKDPLLASAAETVLDEHKYLQSTKRVPDGSWNRLERYNRRRKSCGV